MVNFVTARERTGRQRVSRDSKTLTFTLSLGNRVTVTKHTEVWGRVADSRVADGSGQQQSREGRHKKYKRSNEVGRENRSSE